ncbi:MULTISPECIES: M20 aminoacylase family protein [Rhizobium/Agrobacterium group]|uniref:M20 aminoacylase family protein n=1 Tax=Rhizobium/Agrobacterium group TaxID=227290 RepID=UPI0012E7D77A|nr:MULTISPECIES: M20 aminoacylase family protein [Rhizobium/Agrobacterium group]MCF1473835.1 amidohydrolase [Allorhizobium ampelinum]MVA50077.1 amidohydrolase [Agrobacterium vitis]MVA72459.1 amidohydrolase [Agrobacterium vitis]NSZ51021.1 amidohydrolase [Agrobacterium vitis]NTA33022.1 amidohydrolase [Agrobacterium vitis]
MPILNRAAELEADVRQWRHHLHQNPEILYDVHETAAFVTEKLKEFGVDEVVTGLGRTGVVGLIKGRGDGSRVIGLRADMDALPLQEITGKAWASKTDGRMHACGHDGHTAMLLGAAKYLAENRNFNGSVAVIFQPAEEGGAGALAMVEDGLMERFDIAEVYGMHNMPGMPVGTFAIRKGGIMAAPDKFFITIKGRGGHAAEPHRAIDPIAIGAQIVTNLQLIAARSANPVRSVVVSVTRFQAGTTHNIIPEQAELTGTVRTHDDETQDMAERRIREIVAGVASAHGAEADVIYERPCPVTANHPEETDNAARAAIDIVGEGNVNTDVDPSMAGEDFAFMLKARPGAYIMIGNGNTAGLHNPAYDFNDEAIAYGISYWVRLAEQRLAD